MANPDWWATLLLALVSFRVFRLIAEDTILDRPRMWLLRFDSDGPKEGFRAKWSEFITCPWCAGFWITGIVLGGYCVVYGWIGFFSFFVHWFAISAFVGLVEKNLDKTE